MDIEIHYADLVLPIRKGLASRHALLTLKEAAWAAEEPHAAHLSRMVNGAFETLRVPILSPDTERLDTFVGERLKPLLPLLTKARATGGVCCTECTGKAAVACDGVNDPLHVQSSGHCLRPLKECCELAVRTAHRLYGALSTANQLRHAVVNFEVAEACPRDAIHCVSGSSLYRDGPTDQLTRITLHIGLDHWELQSYAAIALILAHELVCHAAHGLLREKTRRAPTGPEDRYVEGWMDFVARTALLEEVATSQQHGQLSPATPLSVAQALGVAGEIGVWRAAEARKSSCESRGNDFAAPHRRYGEKQASAAQIMFGRLGASSAFFEFSAAFNAAPTTKLERDAFLEDVEVVSCMIGQAGHRLTRALQRFTQTHDIDEFRHSLRDEGGE